MTTITQIENFFDRSLSGLVHGKTILADKEYEFRQWNGEQLCSKLIGFDTETEVVNGPDIPRLAVATAYDGQMCFLIHPDHLGRFIRKHRGCNFVGHNLGGFDFHVVRQHLQQRRDRKAAKAWFRIADSGRLGCTMLLDQLAQLARGYVFPRNCDLGIIAERWAGIPDIDKENPWRLRFGEIIGVDWRTVDPAAWEYAASDPIATRIAFVRLRNKARRLVDHQGIDPSLVKRYGLLTQRIQVRAAIVLDDIYHRGVCLDIAQRDVTEQRLRDRLNGLVAELESVPELSGIFHRYKKTGELQYSKSGKPRTCEKQLREVLQKVADDCDITVPLTPKKKAITISRKFWEQHVDAAPFILQWVRLDEVAKLIQFFRKLDSEHVHPRYQTLVRTGRTSCSAPNIQQIPKSGGFREMFLPSPGHVFFIIDYSALELRTLAAECERRFQKSVLADVIRVGTDPHAHTASLLLGMELDEFLALKNSDPARFKVARQQAKAINFGTPAGFSPPSLSAYAKLTYHIDLNIEDATEFRDRFLYHIYPEIGQYLESDLEEVVAHNLQTAEGRVRHEFPNTGLLCAARKVVGGNPYKRDGTPYDPDFIHSTWLRLEVLNNNPDLEQALFEREPNESLQLDLFNGTVLTATGRIRGRVSFTQRRNTPFQGMAADGCKIALWELYKAGYRVVAFVHDEFVIELPEDADHTAEAERINEICCRNMEKVTETVPVACEYALARCWTKDAEAVYDQEGRLVLWEPGPGDGDR